jgi:hypothetical protein
VVNFEPMAAQRLASIIRLAYRTIANALAHRTSLTSSVIDACGASNAPPSHRQQVNFGCVGPAPCSRQPVFGS